MDVQQETLKAWEYLTAALGSDLPIIQQEVAAGVSHLVCWGGEFYSVLRPEQAATGAELVIVGGAGKNSVKWTEKIHEWARVKGFKTVRLHTLHPDAMLRMGKSLGYQRAETILRAVL